MIETIEWFMPPVLPAHNGGEDPVVLVKLADGDVIQAFLQDGQWRVAADASMIPNPAVIAWAHLPNGPVAPKRGRGRK